MVAYVTGSLVFGFSSDRLARAGVSRLTVFKAGLVVCVAAFCLLAAGVTSGLGVLLAVYGFATISGALAYPLMTGLFGPEGREERERETLEGARRNHGNIASRLRVLHAPATFRLAPNVAYRVDVKAGQLVEHVRPMPAPTTKRVARKRKR